VNHKNGKFVKTHGMFGTPIYGVWNAMLQRCNNPNMENYERYGGRGISVCKEWLRFEGFYKDMGDSPPGMSIDRIDNNGNYSASNCRWVTRTAQQRNKRSNVMVEYKGLNLCLAEWSERIGVKAVTLRSRYKKGLKPPELFKKVSIKK
jgi:hypothetical protein